MDSKQEVTAEQNLQAILTVLKFDGDIPLHKDGSEAGKTSMNLATKLYSDGRGNDIFYVSIDKPHANCEAYVFCDNKGNCSYFDFSLRTVVINNEIVHERAPSWIEDAVEKVAQDYRFEHSQANEGADKAFLAALNTPYPGE